MQEDYKLEKGKDQPSALRAGKPGLAPRLVGRKGSLGVNLQAITGLKAKSYYFSRII